MAAMEISKCGLHDSRMMALFGWMTIMTKRYTGAAKRTVLAVGAGDKVFEALESGLCSRNEEFLRQSN